MLTKTTSIIIQLVVWLVLLLFLFFMGLEFNTVQTSLVKAFLNVILLILLAFVNSKILVPKLFTSKLIIFYFAAAIGLIVLYVFISKEIVFSNSSDIRITIQQIGSENHKVTNAWMLLKLVAITLSVGVLFASTVFALIKEMYVQNKLKMQVEIEKKASELKLINTQFSPHFFLNSLNNLYSISKLKPEKISSFIEKLTALMQYVTYEQMEDKVLLGKEIDFIKNYIYFQQEKGDDLFKVITDFDNTNTSLLIEPRLLIPFVENAFKYAYQPNKTMSVNITLQTKIDALHFTVTNDISDYKRRENEDGYFGVGINSVKELLLNLYPKKHELNISNTEKKYCVELILKLNDE